MNVKYLSWIMMLLLFASCSGDDIESEDPVYVQVLLKNTGWHWHDKWLDVYDDWYQEGYDSYELHFLDDNTGYLLNYWWRKDDERYGGTDFDHFYYEVKSDGTIHLDFITHDAVDLKINQIKIENDHCLSCVGPDCDLLLEKMEKVDTERISEYTFKFENASLFLNSAGTMVIKGSGKLAVDGVTEENCQQIYKWQNHYVKSVEFDGGITHIGDYLFYKSNVETIKNWDSVESIGAFAFAGSQLNCSLPKNLKRIDHNAFAASNLTDLSNIACRDCWIGKEAFYNCKKLKSVNEYFIGSATHIGDYAFLYCQKLALGDLHFKSQIDSIGHMALGVNKIQSVSFDEGIKYIESFAFSPSETTIQDELRLPNSIKSIHTGTFDNFRVNKIYLGNAVEYIDDHPFIYMNGKMIGDLYVPMDNPVSFKENYFSPYLIEYYNNNYQYFKLDHLWTLHVPKGSKKLYQQAYVWKGFGTIVDDL